MNRSPIILCLVAIIAFLSASPSAVAGPYVFGISDDSKIHQVDLTDFTDSIVFDTGLPGLTNGVAWDEDGGRLYYRNKEDSSLYFWTRSTNTQQVLTGPALPTGFNANAAMYNGAYWYVEDGTDTLVRASFDFSLPNSPTIGNVESFADFDGSVLTSFYFGDVSISSSGILYGSSDHGLFSVDISGPSPSDFRIVAPSFGVRQFGFDPSKSFLYTQDYETGQWYTSDLNGLENSLNQASNVSFATTPLRDIGDVIGDMPEPAVWQSLLLGLFALSVHRFGWSSLRARMCAAKSRTAV